MRKIVLITGASSEVGKEIQRIFSNNGWIVYAATRNPKKIKNSPKIHPISLDITSDNSCKNAVKLILKKEGKIDALVNAAGYSLIGPSLDFSSQEYLSVLNTNTVGAFRLIKEIAPAMKKDKAGKIVNITSMCGLISLPNFGPYCSSKFAMEALGLALRYELGKYNVWVTNIAPGAMKGLLDRKISMPHKPVREKIKLLNLIMPMVTTEMVAQKVFEVVTKDRPGGSIVMGVDAKMTYLLHKVLPFGLWDRVQFFMWNKS